MKILLISHGAGPFGAERVLLGLAEGLARRGYQVILDFPHDGPAVGRAREIAGIEISIEERRRLPRTLAEAPGFFAAAPGAIATLRRRVSAIRPAVVWVNSLYNPWAALGARSAGARVIWHLHENRPSEPAGSGLALLMGWAADRLVTVSEHAAEGYRRYPWLRRRIRPIHNPLLGSWVPRPAPAVAPFTVGYVGQLEPRKHVRDLVHAIERVPDVRGVIVGDGKAADEVDDAIRRSGVDPRIERTGYQPRPAEWLSRFDCLAIPSLGEAFGLVALEAMASGVPVIAARSGALPEVLSKAALYHDPGSVADLARQIGRLRDDPALRQQLRAEGLRRVEQFGCDAWLDRVEDVIQETTGRSSR